MKYRELVQFEPIRSIIELRTADDSIIDNYVVSDRMADVLNDIIIEQLQFDRPIDHKGIMVVGNYGTGKSHLMSVIAAIAEHSGTSDRLQNQTVAAKAKEIEGKFKVLRIEFDGIDMPFREVLFREMTAYLQSIGVHYEMPELSQVLSNKDELVKLMSAFHEVHPDQGFILMIDELLDYLRSRKEQELMLDLNFLRAMGEITQTTRFRFMTGVQEMLFDNPRFAFVAEQLRRVKERTVQAIIAREDIEFVVSQRLLKKNDKQKAYIREHLQKFAPLYDKLGEQLEKHVELFPVHPAYLSAFQKVKIAEKRVALTTISDEIDKLLDQDVPEESPGVVSYDNYWTYIQSDSTLRSDPDVREVMEKADVLLDRVEFSFQKPTYKPMARRIVQALSVFRLTTDDLRVRIGMTPLEMRDQLFLFDKNCDMDVEFLDATIESTLKEILKSVSYQFISMNQENGQYYLDLDKDVPVDDHIASKAETLSGEQLDRYYFQVLERVLECSPTTYVTGYRIWHHELDWYNHKATRPGYLFFGAPNERSTAQPERDFYIYFLQTFDVPKFKDEKKLDEVFFVLDTKDQALYHNLKLYAGAKEMASTASTATKNLYEEKASYYIRELMTWFKLNMPTSYKMTYKGITKKLVDWSFAAPAQASVREIVDTAADDCLKEWFEEKYPDYPVFRTDKTCIKWDVMKTTYIPEALSSINSANRTKTARALLEGLVLLDGDKINVEKSGYAAWLLRLINAKDHNQVVNASEILHIDRIAGGMEVKRTIEFKLEPELLAVLLVALVYSGDIVITINGSTYDSMKLDELIRLKAEGIMEFSHIKKPSDLPLAELRALFDLFNISHGLLQPQSQTNGVAQLQVEVDKLLKEIVKLEQDIRSGIPTWDFPLLSDTDIRDNQQKLRKLNEFLQGLNVYNTPARLKNFKYSIPDIDAMQEHILLAKQLRSWEQKAAQVTQRAQYIVNALNHVQVKHEWHVAAEAALEDILQALKAGEDCQKEIQGLHKLKDKYVELYYAMHSSARLGISDENKKDQLLQDGRYAMLRQLASISILPSRQLEEWKAKLEQLKFCWNLKRDDLEHAVICPHCRYRPKDEPYVQQVSIAKLNEELEELTTSWTDTVINTLNDDEIKDSITLLGNDQRQLLDQFVKDGKFSSPINLKLVQTLKELFEGIHKVELSADQLFEMAGNGHPLTVDELRNRFEALVRDYVGTGQGNRVRILLQKGDEENG
ncbi:DUF6079 family protein [Brevibacillus centrosporus]|uniref:DUF6079 family protein n=1 Tax=Brevibacillus centrosporus TaxID=54910 RepID=UPI000F0A72CC|nr:DUF6079 family protein [Brevibacillus centrosporus]MEC2130247.1 DUF6079 family protein [Brevibacillus centrosporus]RNB70963.1 ATP-binding protein [Brevibacillus centrosporus]GED30277.1 hypothetical protein BCE02nite_14180 [Brevibacillus centrosporus]